MTSERNKRVEEESTNRCAWRWKERPREQAKGRKRCPWVVMEGGREDGGVWSGCWGKRERSTVSENPKEVQSQRKWSMQQCPPHTVPVKALVQFTRRPTRIEAFQRNLKNSFSKPGQKCVREAFKHSAQTKIQVPHAGCGLSDQPEQRPRLLKLG